MSEQIPYETFQIFFWNLVLQPHQRSLFCLNTLFFKKEILLASFVSIYIFVWTLCQMQPGVRGVIFGHLSSFICRCDADVVINNIFKVFDPSGSGKVVPQELLLAFSMSMKGSGDNLLWNFCSYQPNVLKRKLFKFNMCFKVEQILLFMRFKA